ncbi:branched-chain amino acid ABC transporter permease [Enemella sp. A6]|uniref:branched-chain amino acid ABC transporter permease n=1 Tax=Enemella sp. A6 TaxID=3440152 RepID=UPI003EBE267E
MSTPTTTYKFSRAGDRWPPLVAAAALLLVFLWTGGMASRHDMIVLTCTYALIALGMYIPFVMAGTMSMAYNAYAALGAYGVALIAAHTGLPIWVGWLLGIIAAVIIAVVLSLATRRLSGFFLAAVTLLFGTAFEYWAGVSKWSGGAGGIGNIPRVSFFGWEPSRAVQVVMALVLVWLVTVLVERMRRSPFGATVRAMHEKRLSVDTGGVKTSTLVTVCLGVGAGIASLGGSLFATFVRGITPETFTLHVVFLAIFMPLIGGRLSAWGAVLGAFLVVQLTLNFPWAASGQLILAIAVLVVMLAAPGGVLGWIDSAWRFVRRMISKERSA